MKFTPLTQFDFHHRLAETTGTVLVLFTAPGCSACRHMRLVLEILASRHPDWGLFEVDAGQDMALTREFEVFHLPGLFLYRGGRYHAAVATEAVPTSMESVIREKCALPPEEAP